MYLHFAENRLSLIAIHCISIVLSECEILLHNYLLRVIVRNSISLNAIDIVVRYRYIAFWKFIAFQNSLGVMGEIPMVFIGWNCVGIVNLSIICNWEIIVSAWYCGNDLDFRRCIKVKRWLTSRWYEKSIIWCVFANVKTRTRCFLLPLPLLPCVTFLRDLCAVKECGGCHCNTWNYCKLE